MVYCVTKGFHSFTSFNNNLILLLGKKALGVGEKHSAALVLHFPFPFFDKRNRNLKTELLCKRARFLIKLGEKFTTPSATKPVPEWFLIWPFKSKLYITQEHCMLLPNPRVLNWKYLNAAKKLTNLFLYLLLGWYLNVLAIYFKRSSFKLDCFRIFYFNKFCWTLAKNFFFVLV